MERKMEREKWREREMGRESEKWREINGDKNGGMDGKREKEGI